ncbi:hypothetical protein AGMMS50230_21750 [Spirochaetia bacterium]|nr:hypothetical protein AGMMS50230_21750 [Spirochaetia bacterium]
MWTGINLIKKENIDEKIFFEYGIYLVINGLDSEIIRRKLEKLRNNEKDPVVSILKKFTIDAFVIIQWGTNPKVLSDALHGVLNYILLMYGIPAIDKKIY